DQILPAGRPLRQKRDVVAFHDFEAAAEVLRDPACHVPKSLWRQPALVAKAAVDRQRVPVAKVLDDHVQHPPSKKCASSTCCANGLTLTLWTNAALGSQAAIGCLSEQPKHEATTVQRERSTVQGDSYAEPVTPLGPSAAEPHEQQPNEDDAGPGRENERYRRTPASVPRRAQQDCQILRLAKRADQPAARQVGASYEEGGREHHDADGGVVVRHKAEKETEQGDGPSPAAHEGVALEQQGRRDEIRTQHVADAREQHEGSKKMRESSFAGQ